MKRKIVTCDTIDDIFDLCERALYSNNYFEARSCLKTIEKTILSDKPIIKRRKDNGNYYKNPRF